MYSGTGKIMGIRSEVRGALTSYTIDTYAGPYRYGLVKGMS